MIASIYTNKNILKKIKEEFEKSKILKLENFFTKETYNQIENSVDKSTFKHKKIADKFSYAKSTTPKEIISLLNQQEFQKFIQEMTNKKISTIELKKFSHRDYTLLHDEVNGAGGERYEKRILQFTESHIARSGAGGGKQTKLLFFICPSWQPDHGGNFVFQTKQGKVFYITPMQNALAIIEKQSDWKEFVQYVNHLANEKSVIVIEANLI